MSQLQWLKSADGRLTCGTPGYIAPELFADGKASPQSDMFSFGVTLWQLAAGHWLRLMRSRMAAIPSNTSTGSSSRHTSTQ
jgi:serine/threonine protein kinase